MNANWIILIVIAVVVGGYAIWQNRVIIVETGKKLVGGGGKGTGPEKPL